MHPRSTKTDTYIDCPIMSTFSDNPGSELPSLSGGAYPGPLPPVENPSFCQPTESSQRRALRERRPYNSYGRRLPRERRLRGICPVVIGTTHHPPTRCSMGQICRASNKAASICGLPARFGGDRTTMERYHRITVNSNTFEKRIAVVLHIVALRKRRTT